MIVSQFWLRSRWTKDYPAAEFEVMVTNLEPVELRFRFRFVATQVTKSINIQDSTQFLRDRIDPLSNSGGNTTLLAKQDWHRDGQLYSTRWDVVIGPGETHRTGLASTAPLTPVNSVPGVFRPGGVLRGHWELTLPILERGPPASQPKAQIKQPARVLIAAFHRIHLDDGGLSVPNNPWTLPLAAGRAEHLVPPDALVSGVVATTATPQRKATRRRTR